MYFNAACFVKISADKILIYFSFFLENRTSHFMQTLSLGDNLHEVLDPFFLGKIRKNIVQFVILLNLPLASYSMTVSKQ